MSTQSGPVQATNWPTVILITACSYGAAMQIGKIPPLMEDIRAEMSQGLVALGWLASAVNVKAALTALAIGITADRLGRRRLFVIGAVLLLVGGLLARHAETASALLLLRMVEGLGFVALVVTSPSLIGGMTRREDMGMALGMWASYLPGGMAIMMVLAPLLAPDLGWRGVFDVGSFVAFLTLLAAIHVARTVGPPPKAPPLRLVELRPLVRQRAVWLICIGFVCFTGSWFSLAAWLPTMAREVAGADITVAGLATAAVVAGNGISNWIGGWLLSRGLARWKMSAIANVILFMLAGAIFLLDLPMVVRLVLCFCFTLVGGTQITAYYAAVPIYAPTPRLVGSLNGLFVQSANTGMALGPPLLAAVAIAYGGDWSGSGWLIMTLAATGTTAAVLLGRLEAKAAGNATPAPR